VHVEAVLSQGVTISTSSFVQNAKRWQKRLGRRWTTSKKGSAVATDATRIPEKAWFRIEWDWM
jgi:hypothetical protein